MDGGPQYERQPHRPRDQRPEVLSPARRVAFPCCYQVSRHDENRNETVWPPRTCHDKLPLKTSAGSEFVPLSGGMKFFLSLVPFVIVFQVREIILDSACLWTTATLLFFSTMLSTFRI